MNCIKIGVPGKLILGDYFQENMTSQRPFLWLKIRFPGRPIFIQFIPGCSWARTGAARRSASRPSPPARQSGTTRPQSSGLSCPAWLRGERVRTRAVRKSQVRECLGFCTADFWSSLVYKSAEQETQTLPNLTLPISSGYLLKFLLLSNGSLQMFLSEVLLKSR